MTTVLIERCDSASRPWVTTSDRRDRPTRYLQTALTAPDVVVLDMGLPDMDGIESLPDHSGWSRTCHHHPLGVGAETVSCRAGAGGERLRHKPFSMPDSKQDPGP